MKGLRSFIVLFVFTHSPTTIESIKPEVTRIYIHSSTVNSAAFFFIISGVLSTATTTTTKIKMTSLSVIFVLSKPREPQWAKRAIGKLLLADCYWLHIRTNGFRLVLKTHTKFGDRKLILDMPHVLRSAKQNIVLTFCNIVEPVD